MFCFFKSKITHRSTTYYDIKNFAVYNNKWLKHEYNRFWHVFCQHLGKPQNVIHFGRLVKHFWHSSLLLH